MLNVENLLRHSKRQVTQFVFPNQEIRLEIDLSSTTILLWIFCHGAPAQVLHSHLGNLRNRIPCRGPYLDELVSPEPVTVCTTNCTSDVEEQLTFAISPIGVYFIPKSASPRLRKISSQPSKPSFLHFAQCSTSAEEGDNAHSEEHRQSFEQVPAGIVKKEDSLDPND